MGQDVDQALSHIDATRAALERDIDELFGRMPEASVLASRAKTYGAAAGGAAVVVGIATVRAKRSSADRARRHDARIAAEELARAFAPAPAAPPPRRRLGTVAAVLALGVAAAALVARTRT